MFKTTCLKSGFLHQVRKIVSFAWSHCFLRWKNIVTQLMLQLQHSGVSFLMIWLSWKQECSKLSQVLLLKIWAKKGVSRYGHAKNYYIA